MNLWKPLILAAGLIAAGVLLRELPLRGIGGALDAATRAPSGWVAFLGLGAAVTALGLPRQTVAYAGGFAFGLSFGMTLALAAQMTGCALAFAWARVVARDWTRRRLSGRLARMDRFLSNSPLTATLMLRLLPIGNNLATNLLAGVSGVGAVPFFAGSALGYLPQTAIFALLGAGVRLGGRWELALAGVGFAASGLLGLVLLRRLRSQQRVPD